MIKTYEDGDWEVIKIKHRKALELVADTATAHVNNNEFYNIGTYNSLEHAVTALGEIENER